MIVFEMIVARVKLRVHFQYHVADLLDEMTVATSEYDVLTTDVFDFMGFFEFDPYEFKRSQNVDVHGR